MPPNENDLKQLSSKRIQNSNYSYNQNNSKKKTKMKDE